MEPNENQKLLGRRLTEEFGTALREMTPLQREAIRTTMEQMQIQMQRQEQQNDRERTEWITRRRDELINLNRAMALNTRRDVPTREEYLAGYGGLTRAQYERIRQQAQEQAETEWEQFAQRELWLRQRQEQLIQEQPGLTKKQIREQAERELQEREQERTRELLEEILPRQLLGPLERRELLNEGRQEIRRIEEQMGNLNLQPQVPNAPLPTIIPQRPLSPLRPTTPPRPDQLLPPLHVPYFQQAMERTVPGVPIPEPVREMGTPMQQPQATDQITLEDLAPRWRQFLVGAPREGITTTNPPQQLIPQQPVTGTLLQGLPPIPAQPVIETTLQGLPPDLLPERPLIPLQLFPPQPVTGTLLQGLPPIPAPEPLQRPGYLNIVTQPPIETPPRTVYVTGEIPLPAPLPIETEPTIFTEAQLRAMTVPVIKGILVQQRIPFLAKERKQELIDHYIRYMIPRLGQPTPPRRPISPIGLPTAATDEGQPPVFNEYQLRAMTKDLIINELRRHGIPFNLRWPKAQLIEQYLILTGHRAPEQVQTPLGGRIEYPIRLRQEEEQARRERERQRQTRTPPTVTVAPITDIPAKMRRLATNIEYNEPRRLNLVHVTGNGNLENLNFNNFFHRSTIYEKDDRYYTVLDRFIGETRTELLNYLPLIFNGISFDGNKDEVVSLIWWKYLYNYTSRLNNDDWLWVGTQSTESLISLFPEYPYPRDRASVLFALDSGIMPPIEPYNATIVEQLINPNIDSKILLDKAHYIYKYYGEDNKTPSVLSPYRFLANQTYSQLELFFDPLYNQTATEEQVAQALGMIIPPNVITRSYLLNNLFYYRYVADRIQTKIVPQPPPPLHGNNAPNLKNILLYYNDEELFNYYEPIFTEWTDRLQLIEKIIQEGRGGSLWRLSSTYCNNDDRMNVIMLTPREKDDPNDPILSYGIAGNYRCYNLSELDFVWREYEGEGFRFMVPDYIKGDPMPDFPLESINQLRILLRAHVGRKPIFTSLLEKIDIGLAHHNAITRRFRDIRIYYEHLPEEQKLLVNEYFAWLFSLGMTMRFWRGPGSPYPQNWMEGGGTGTEFCTLATRDTNVIAKFAQRTALFDRIEHYPELYQWILSLPRIRYNFTDGEVAMGVETINYIITEAQDGNFCLADASDKIIQTSYYLIMQTLNLTTDAQFNQFINNVLHMTNQPPFEPLRLQQTRHTDPYHRNLREVQA